jgi:hypothetical protein
MWGVRWAYERFGAWACRRMGVSAHGRFGVWAFRRMGVVGTSTRWTLRSDGTYRTHGTYEWASRVTLVPWVP